MEGGRVEGEWHSQRDELEVVVCKWVERQVFFLAPCNYPPHPPPPSPPLTSRSCSSRAFFLAALLAAAEGFAAFFLPPSSSSSLPSSLSSSSCRPPQEEAGRPRKPGRPEGSPADENQGGGLRERVEGEGGRGRWRVVECGRVRRVTSSAETCQPPVKRLTWPVSVSILLLLFLLIVLLL